VGGVGICVDFWRGYIGGIFTPRLVLILLVWQRVGCKFLLGNYLKLQDLLLVCGTAPPSSLVSEDWRVGSSLSFLFLVRGGVRGEGHWQSEEEIGASLNPEPPPQDSLVGKIENVGI